MMAIEVQAHELFDFLHGVGNFHEATMVRKGREIKNKYIEVKKGDRGFLSDSFILRDNDVTPKDSVVVAKEVLFCNGRENCLRACGGMGKCADHCDKKNGDDRAKFGHRCSFKVSLKMMYGKVGTWRVIIEGSHVPSTCVWQRPKKKNQSSNLEVRCKQGKSQFGFHSNRIIQINAIILLYILKRHAYTGCKVLIASY